MQRLDLRTLRYDAFGKSVLIDGRKVVLEIAHDALEALSNSSLTVEEALSLTANEQKRLTRLAEWVPADDGRVHITKRVLLSDGRYEIEEEV